MRCWGLGRQPASCAFLDPSATLIARIIDSLCSACRAALLAVWAAQALLLAFALKLKVSAAAADVAADGPGATRLGSFQVQPPVHRIMRLGIIWGFPHP